ncbi:1-aminocyclopropane-1-carboxylate deaminase/D-cysteine desulfhydrase [Dyadobacter aurulentus]|uniref:1-aminocyclopropane-1-carboxylate deaminase/D-cysteine desulfhydrase n=1 Tax=Dyadobacter sp. UC 10 TaxID=2605428 RepID=UPI0011F3C680|nr:pyridoxal-phosphate dependent enzyme [Dyadobacter sp. UC 10]KAA0991783.1 pyridoxal-phosphate dependent enzyme [Dyadobacter sp. UC 10]
MDLLSHSPPTPLQELHNELCEKAAVRLFVKRDDLIHPEVSGNKWRKLKYVLKEVKQLEIDRVLTFGGAYSNHLYALASACSELDIKAIGIVRGERPVEESATLQFCRQKGMELHFVTREEYKLRQSEEYQSSLSQQFDYPYLIPEGGTSVLALPGVSELTTEVKNQLGIVPDYYCVAAGTGGTAAGILCTGANVVAFSALKGGGFLKDEIDGLIQDYQNPGILDLQTSYHFGGYAKWNAGLLDFIDDFKNRFDIQLEQVYTGKMLYGVFDLIKKGYFSRNAIIVAVHTGGLQGLVRK